MTLKILKTSLSFREMNSTYSDTQQSNAKMRHMLNVLMPSVVMLCVILLSVIMMRDIMLVSLR